MTHGQNGFQTNLCCLLKMYILLTNCNILLKAGPKAQNKEQAKLWINWPDLKIPFKADRPLALEFISSALPFLPD